jgi:hypothetical protein
MIDGARHRGGARFIALAALAAGLLAATPGCGETPTGGASASASQKLPTPPFTGRLTSERVLAAKGLVAHKDDWSTAYAKLQAQLGRPQKVTAEGMHQWFVVEADRCSYVEIGKDSDGTVGLIMPPVTATKGEGPVVAYRACLEVAGLTDGPAEDPEAAGPPSGGSAVPLEMFLDLAVRARSKWKDKRVKVIALHGGSTGPTAAPGAGALGIASITLKAKAGPSAPSTVCALRKDTPVPTTAADVPVIAEGVVVLRETVDAKGEGGLEAALQDCTLDFEAAAALSPP